MQGVLSIPARVWATFRKYVWAGPADHEGADIAVVGAQGAHFVDAAGQLKKSVRFSIEERCPVAVVRIDATGGYGYLTRDESWAVPATLFDKEGQVRWRSKSLARD